MSEMQIMLPRGRPRDLAVEDAVLAAVNAHRALNIETIRRQVSEQLNREVSWRTINRHLQHLESRQMVRRHVFGRFKTKMTVLITDPSIQLT